MVRSHGDIYGKQENLTRKVHIDCLIDRFEVSSGWPRVIERLLTIMLFWW